MNVLINQSTWQDLPAIHMESEHISLICIPSLGGKLVSLLDKKTNYEWLAGPNLLAPKSIPYAASFVENGYFGWDEMFPTIDACTYPAQGPYAGNIMPDHGDAWSLQWLIEDYSSGKLVMSVNGKALPYHLERTLVFKAQDTLSMQYSITNVGEDEFTFLWAAHPLFSSQPGMEILLPQDVKELVNAKELLTWGEIGKRYSWPNTISCDGYAWNLNEIGIAGAQEYRKFFVDPDKPISWASLHNTRKGNWLRMSWSPDQLPYFGIWIDEGYYTPNSLVALEPTTGYFDTLERAWQHKAAPLLKPGEKYSWQIEVRIGSKLKRLLEWELVS